MTERQKVAFQGHSIGILTCLSTISFFMDYFGLEKTIEYMRDHWITMPCWPWVVVFFASVIWLHLLSSRRPQ